MLRIKKILYPTDFSNSSKQAYPHALFLAEKYGAELHILHVITIHTSDDYDPAYDFPHLAEYNIHLEEHAAEKSEELIRAYNTSTTKVIKIQKRGYSPSAIILEYANNYDIDIIVMGTHGRRGLGYLFLGSVAEEVTRFSKCPVYTIRGQKLVKPVEKINKILVPVDFSVHCKKAIVYAKNLCKDYDAKLEVIHVIEEPIPPVLFTAGKSSILELLPNLYKNSLKLIDQIVHNVSGPAVETNVKVIEGHVSRKILKYSEENNVDLIVVSTHGLSDLNQFLLGSVAEKIIRRSICPVFTVKSFGKQIL